MGITYGARENPDTTDDDTSFVKVYSDTDWAGDISTSRLISGDAFLAAGGPIAWAQISKSRLRFSPAKLSTLPRIRQHAKPRGYAFYYTKLILLRSQRSHYF
jgi:hypothetical protein